EAKKEPRLEVVLVKDKKPVVIKTVKGGYVPGQWYRLSSELVDNQIRFSVDGKELIRASNPLFSGGCTGLYVKSGAPVEFDDFRVLSVNRTDDEGVAAMPWQFFGGQWANSGDSITAKSGSVPSVAVIGLSSWENMDISAAVTSADAKVKGRCGIVAAFRDPGNYISYVVENGAGKLVQMQNGKESVLAEGGAPEQGKPMRMRIDRGVIHAGDMNIFVPNLNSGRVGLIAAGDVEAKFDSFNANEIDPPLPVVSINEIFDEENLMSIWSGVAGDWKSYPKKPGGYDRAFWHRAPFYGDAEIEALMPYERKDDWSIGLSLCKEEAGRGYTMTMKKSDDANIVKLFRDQDEVASAKLPLDTVPLRLRFRKSGSLFLGLVNDQVVLTWKDSEPLNGTKVAWAEHGMPELKAEEVQIYSKSLLNYSFNSAPSDWRRAGGVWQVTNRWECDPRWSFMAGMPPVLALKRSERMLRTLSLENTSWVAESLKAQANLISDQKSELAAIWNKREISGDMVVEAFVGQMMDETRGGGNYQNYVKNFCVTLCSDGKDLNKGYTIIFGGDNNTRSMILRHGKVVASKNVGIPARANIHRKWFRLRTEKVGDTINFEVSFQDSRNRPEETIVELSYKDPEPLKGNRVALWTYDNGMLIARTRIAASEIGASEDPFGDYPREAKCYYTVADATPAAAENK
ncbi:MAG: hypothetical protein JXR97_14795, partial [Planctomycetes bacterium]|nr:hypothetical protein [Planctomycetota bacterium]